MTLPRLLAHLANDHRPEREKLVCVFQSLDMMFYWAAIAFRSGRKKRCESWGQRSDGEQRSGRVAGNQTRAWLTP